MSLWSRLKSGLSRSSDALGSSLSGLMGGKKLSPETLGELEDALIMADLGVATAATIASKFGSALIGASAIGPIVHQFIVGAFNGSKEPSKLLLSSTDEKSCVTVSKDEQSGIAETLVEVSESNGMVQNVSGAMIQYKPISETQIEVSESEEIVQPIPLATVQYASSNVVVDLSNKSSEKSCDTLIEELSSAMIIIMSFAAWYRSRSRRASPTPTEGVQRDQCLERAGQAGPYGRRP